jgi:hypothetical protein
MEKSTPLKFTAELLQHGTLNAAYIEFPFDVEELFGVKGQVKIKALIEGKVMYRGSLAKMGHDCHVLGITQEIRKQLGKTFGDKITVILDQDLEERIVTIPADIQKVLSKNKKAFEFFSGLSFTHRKEYIRWIGSAKKDETRLKRIDQFMEKLKSGKRPDSK